jgi:hypothetical protein
MRSDVRSASPETITPVLQDPRTGLPSAGIVQLCDDIARDPRYVGFSSVRHGALSLPGLESLPSAEMCSVDGDEERGVANRHARTAKAISRMNVRCDISPTIKKINKTQEK